MEDVIKDLYKTYGQEITLTTTHGKVLEYLGMTLEYSTKGKVKISMRKCLDKSPSELSSDMKGSTKTMTIAHLIYVHTQAKKLPEDKEQQFHYLLAKILYL